MDADGWTALAFVSLHVLMALIGWWYCLAAWLARPPRESNAGAYWLLTLMVLVTMGLGWFLIEAFLRGL